MRFLLAGLLAALLTVVPGATASDIAVVEPDLLSTSIDRVECMTVGSYLRDPVGNARACINTGVQFVQCSIGSDGSLPSVDRVLKCHAAARWVS